MSAGGGGQNLRSFEGIPNERRARVLEHIRPIQPILLRILKDTLTQIKGVEYPHEKGRCKFPDKMYQLIGGSVFKLLDESEETPDIDVEVSHLFASGAKIPYYRELAASEEFRGGPVFKEKIKEKEVQYVVDPIYLALCQAIQQSIRGELMKNQAELDSLTASFGTVDPSKNPETASEYKPLSESYGKFRVSTIFNPFFVTKVQVTVEIEGKIEHILELILHNPMVYTFELAEMRLDPVEVAGFNIPKLGILAKQTAVSLANRLEKKSSLEERLLNPGHFIRVKFKQTEEYLQSELIAMNDKLETNLRRLVKCVRLADEASEKNILEAVDHVLKCIRLKQVEGKQLSLLPHYEAKVTSTLLTAVQEYKEKKRVASLLSETLPAFGNDPEDQKNLQEQKESYLLRKNLPREEAGGGGAAEEEQGQEEEGEEEEQGQEEEGEEEEQGQEEEAGGSSSQPEETKALKREKARLRKLKKLLEIEEERALRYSQEQAEGERLTLQKQENAARAAAAAAAEAAAAETAREQLRVQNSKVEREERRRREEAITILTFQRGVGAAPPSEEDIQQIIQMTKQEDRKKELRDNLDKQRNEMLKSLGITYTILQEPLCLSKELTTTYDIPGRTPLPITGRLTEWHLYRYIARVLEPGRECIVFNLCPALAFQNFFLPSDEYTVDEVIKRRSPAAAGGGGGGGEGPEPSIHSIYEDEGFISQYYLLDIYGKMLTVVESERELKKIQMKYLSHKALFIVESLRQHRLLSEEVLAQIDTTLSRRNLLALCESGEDSMILNIMENALQLVISNIQINLRGKHRSYHRTKSNIDHLLFKLRREIDTIKSQPHLDFLQKSKHVSAYLFKIVMSLRGEFIEEACCAKVRELGKDYVPSVYVFCPRFSLVYTVEDSKAAEADNEKIFREYVLQKFLERGMRLSPVKNSLPEHDKFNFSKRLPPSELLVGGFNQQVLKQFCEEKYPDLLKDSKKKQLLTTFHELSKDFLLADLGERSLPSMACKAISENARLKPQVLDSMLTGLVKNLKKRSVQLDIITQYPGLMPFNTQPYVREAFVMVEGDMGLEEYKASFNEYLQRHAGAPAQAFALEGGGAQPLALEGGGTQPLALEGGGAQPLALEGGGAQPLALEGGAGTTAGVETAAVVQSVKPGNNLNRKSRRKRKTRRSKK